MAALQLLAAAGTAGSGIPANLSPPSSEAPPTFDALRVLRTGKRWKPIDISEIDCSALRCGRKNPADVTVDRRGAVSAALPDPQLWRRPQQGRRRNHGALDSKPRLGWGRGPLIGG